MAEQSAKMNQSERNAMVKVVKGRFEAVRRHAARTRDDLKKAIFDRVMDENQRKVAAAERDMRKIEERARKLREDALAICARHREQGVLLGKAKIENVAQYNDAGKIVNVRVVNASEWKPGEYFKFVGQVANRWFPVDIEREVAQEYRQVEDAHGLGELALAKREQELVEEILLGGVNPEAQREFLERVPTLDSLPSVDDIRALPASS